MMPTAFNRSQEGVPQGRAPQHDWSKIQAKVGGVRVSRVCDPVRCVPGRHVQDPRCSPLKTLVWFSSILSLCCFPIQERPPTQIYADTRAPPPKAEAGPWAWPSQDLGWCLRQGPVFPAISARLSIALRHPWGSKGPWSELESRASCWAQDRSLGKTRGQGHLGTQAFGHVT